MILLQQQNYKDLCTASDLQPAIYKFSKIIDNNYVALWIILHPRSKIKASLHNINTIHKFIDKSLNIHHKNLHISDTGRTRKCTRLFSTRRTLSMNSGKDTYPIAIRYPHPLSKKQRDARAYQRKSKIQSTYQRYNPHGARLGEKEGTG